MKKNADVNSFMKALDCLDDKDCIHITKEADRLANNIKGLGQASAMELLGKLSVLLYVHDTLAQPQIFTYESALNWAKDKVKVKKDKNDA